MDAAAQTLVTQAMAVLGKHAPFDEMDAASLRLLASQLSVAYYPRGTLVAGPASGVADRLFIVRQGVVRGAGAPLREAATDVVLGPGECFPIGALVGRRATVYEYRAESDVFCWELPADAFHRLLAASPRFHAFCTDHLAALVERAHRALRAEAGEALADGAGMLAPLRSALRRAPVSCAPGTPVRKVLQTMREERVGSMVVADAEGVPLGIFTTVDVLERVAAPQAGVDGPVSALMTPRPVTLGEDATLADAAIAMARHGIRHVVVTRDGRLAGVVSERDLFALQRVSLRRTAERIHSARDAGSLAGAAADIRALARHLLAQGVAAEPLTAMVSALNDALSQRVLHLLSAKAGLAGGWCWLALGSEGRTEQTFVSDQDNALIASTAERGALLAFAAEANEALAQAGFPLCRGEIMARNPRWCLDAAQWRAVFDDWIRNPDPEALLNASIFFDLRPLAGEARLAGALREAVLGQARANRAFLRALTENALRSEPPLGVLKDFSAEVLDLKAQGARLFVDAARVLALAAGVAETSTARRLRACGEAQAAEAFHFLQGLRLQHGNAIRVASLRPIDRRVLKEALRGAALLQQRIRMDFAL